MELVARSKPLEARHFGYGVLQHVVAKRWREFSDEEKTALAKMCYEKLSEISSSNTAGSENGPNALPQTAEPFVLKSKVASLMAQVVRQQGADVWIALVPDLALGAASENPALAEVSCLTTRYVAEDVAVHNEDIIGGRMKELLFGLTSTLPQTLPALYRSLEVRMRQSLSRLFFFFSRLFFSGSLAFVRAPARCL
jgi:exportin-5